MGDVVPLRRQEPPFGADEDADGELVRAALAGDVRARERLFFRHYPRVLRLAYRLLGREDEAEDLAQDVCVEALRGLARLRRPDAFGSWIGGICVFRARSRIRRYRMLRRFGLRGQTFVDPDQVIGPGAPGDAAEELRALYAQLDRLEPEVRIALVLRRVQGMTIPEVAEAMDRSPATVKRRLREGLEFLDGYRRTAALEGGDP